ncbi:MAG TPA: inorganic diphosphatase [Adhaeribacter sp.]|nr:inorganic diphosphatase [Adhaeribacter sp.]
MKHLLFCFLLLTAFSSCQTDLANQATFSGNRQLQAIIETPAGSAHPYRYNPEKKEFTVVQEAGQDKVVRFLPYPVNAGFIPSTLIDTSHSQPAHPLPVLIISESQPAGTLLEIIPLGVLILEVKGELQAQVVAVPAKPSGQLTTATDYATFSAKYPAAKKILEQWLVNAHPHIPTRIMGWKDEKYAIDLVRKWMK